MELKPAITKIYEIFQKVNSSQPTRPGFAIKYEPYGSLPDEMGLLMCILSPPNQRFKGREKSYYKIVKRSEELQKLIDPGSFETILAYLNSIFHSIVKPQNDILEHILLVLAGLRLGFVPMHNIKYTFQDPNNPKIFVHSEIRNMQFICYINIVGLKENGLYLSYEKQIRHIKNDVKRGINPNYVQNLPPLRTGDTKFDYKAASLRKHDDNSDSVQQFRNKIHEKQAASQINEELAYETVIDFSTQPEEKKIDSKETKVSYSPFGTPIITPASKNKDNSEEKVDLGLTADNNQNPVALNSPQPRSLPKPPPMPIAQVKDQLNLNIVKTAPQIQEIELNVVDNENRTSDRNSPNSNDNSPQNTHLISQLNLTIKDLNNQNKILQQQLSKIDSDLTAQIDKKNEIIDHMEEKIQKYEKLHKLQRLQEKKPNDLEQNINLKKIEDLNQKLASYERIIQKLEEERKNLKKEQDNNQISSNIQKKQATGIEINYLNIQNENKLLASALKRTDQQNSFLQNEINDLKQSNQVLISEKINLEMILTEMQEEIQEVKKSLNSF